MINQPQLIELSVNDLPEAIKPEEIQGKGYHGHHNTSAPQISVADNNIVVDQAARKYCGTTLREAPICSKPGL